MQAKKVYYTYSVCYAQVTGNSEGAGASKSESVEEKYETEIHFQEKWRGGEERVVQTKRSSMGGI